MRWLLMLLFEIEYEFTRERYYPDEYTCVIGKPNKRIKFRVRGGKKWHYLPTP